jgi:hypothetical protein
MPDRQLQRRWQQSVSMDLTVAGSGSANMAGLKAMPPTLIMVQVRGICLRLKRSANHGPGNVTADRAYTCQWIRWVQER